MDTSAGIDGLVRPTAEMVSITLSSGQAKGIRHVEYLSYPDENFSSEELLSSNATVQNQIRPLEDVYRRQNETFIPGQPVQILDITAERIYNPVTEFLYPYLYTIRVRHGQFEWQIEKRYKHFHDLHKSLVNFVEHETGRSISSLNKSQLSSNGKSENDSLLDQRRKSRPCFPTQNDRVAFINQHTIEQRCGKLKQYLNDVLKHPRFREHFAMREFLEVSPITFVNGLGVSVREGAVAKRSNDDFRGRSIFARAPFVCDKCKFHHGQKWFVLKDSYLVYLNANSAVVGFPMLIDRGFELNRGFRKTGTNNGIQLKNLQRMMIIKCEKEEERDQWFASLEQIKSQSTFNCIQPLNSFAPKREKQYAHWFINGQSYMEAIAKAILAAKEEIFITDWWLSPEILLVRPADDSMRLENLLGKRAEEGIRVYVMVFKDIVSVVGLNSQHTKTRLISKSPTKKNIKVIRHPDHRVLPGTESSFLFSHHEKTVVIDQKIAFIGGIDLCWGRWDTDEHRLIDLGDTNVTKLKTAEELAAEEAAEEEEQAKKEETAQETTEKMADNAANPDPLKPVKVATADFNNPKEDNPEQTNEGDEEKTIKNRISNILHRHKSDEGEEKSKSGMTEFKNELSRLEREVLADEKNAEEKPQKFRKKRRNLLRKMDRDHQENSSDEEDEQQEATKAPNEPRTIIGTTPVAEGEHRLFLGKDYSNSYRKDFEFIDKFDEDYIERQKVARMPWHDEALVVTGQSARDCARHFIQRWNVHKADKYRYNDFYPYLLPKSENDPNLFDKTLLEEILGNDKKLIEVDSQCVRSAAFWSCGLRTIEHSIQNAYLHLIDSAQHFIYIENQFFITIANNSTIKNGIGDALYRRIIRAHNNREKFRIYVVLPLLPGFSNANAVQAVLYFIMRSINKGEKSLYQRLIQAGVNNPEDYISFYGMRNWDILMGTLVTEIIYVHSKLMIVDDRMCICGSANINDRSLLGSRDSEFCLVVHDREMVDSKLNGQIQKVGLFSSTWRKKLFRQILGVKDDQSDFVDDPCSDEFYNSFRKTARENALIYEEVFNTLPTNAVRKFIDVDEYTERPKLQKTNPAEALEKCKQIQGFVVEFPLDFLADDAMMPKWNTSEGMAPMLLWT